MGTWQVFISSMIAKCHCQPSQISRKSNIISLLNGARVGKSTRVLQKRWINFGNVRKLFIMSLKLKSGHMKVLEQLQHTLCTVFLVLCYKQLTLYTLCHISFRTNFSPHRICQRGRPALSYRKPRVESCENTSFAELCLERQLESPNLHFNRCLSNYVFKLKYQVSRWKNQPHQGKPHGDRPKLT